MSQELATRVFVAPAVGAEMTSTGELLARQRNELRIVSDRAGK
jgi:hypothetical protein